MQTTNYPLPPSNSSQLTIELEAHLGTLLAEHELTLLLEREREDFLAQAVHDLRGSITGMKLELYLLENGKPDLHEKYLSDLKASVHEMAARLEEMWARLHQHGEQRHDA